MPNQKPTPKTAPAQKTLKNAFTSKPFMDDMRKQGLEWKNKLLNFAQHWEKFKSIVENNYVLGQDHMRRGNIKDAIFRYKFVIWLEPQYKDVWYHLGCAQMVAGNIRAANDAFAKSLKLKPTHAESRYMLAIAMGNATPKADLPKYIPLDLTLQQFDELAATYNIDQENTFKYEGHTQLANAIRSALTQGRIDHIILDLGVGTGLCGPLLRDTAAHITGVDISPKMLAEAVKVVDERGKKIYDALIKREAIEFITDGPDSSYDIIMSAGLVSYIGDLQTYFEQSARILKSGGILAFTSDTFEGTGHQFNAQTGRFGYSQYYLADLATRFGLTEFRCREASIYPESVGWLCVYRK